MSEGHIDPTRAAFDAFKVLPRGETIHMLNLVRFRDHASYPSGHPDADRGWSGAEAYAEYGRTSQPIFNKLGGRIVWRGSMQLMLTGPAAEQWDAVFVAEYPDAHAFLAMVTDPDYRLAVVHRQAAVANSRLIRCQPGQGGAGFA